MPSARPIDEPSALVADVGGTHIRLALATSQGLEHRETWLCSGFETINAALKTYLQSSAPDQTPHLAALAVACPVAGDQIELTNQHWSFSIAQLRQDLELQDLLVVNDFTALAAAIPKLEENDTRLLKQGVADESAAIAVLGPGTGLGVSGLLRSDRGWSPLSAEGGHCTLAATTEREWAVIEILRQEFGRVSNERVLSGPGLVNLYRALCRIDGESPLKTTPAVIVREATESPDSRESTAVKMFSGWLGAAAGDLVLTLGARGGVFLGGGVLPKMIDVFDRNYFVERFLDKGRFRGYLEPVPVRLVLNTQIALVGAAAIIQER